MGRKRISEEIEDSYKTWESGDIISISSGTDSGKSYFVQNILAEYAKENNDLILYLVPRVRLKEQIEAILEQKGITNITVKMYQAVEAMCNNHSADNGWLDAYKYIVCDESHYFTNDASFNDYTDLSLKHILSAANAITILLSATGDTLIRYIKRFYQERNLNEYFLERNYSFIDKLVAYQSDNYLYKAIDWLVKNNHKTMIFIQSDNKAYEIFKQYEQYSTFVCGKHSRYNKYINEDRVKVITKEERFDTLLLITTSALDVGVNIKDLDVKHLIIDMLDIDTFLQCLGRKRLFDKVDEKINVMFKNYTNQQLGGYMSNEAVRVNLGQLFYGTIESTKGKHTLLSDIFYIDSKGTVQVNDMKYLKSAVNLDRYREYVNSPNGYLKEIQVQLDYKDKIHIHDYLNDEYEKRELLEAYDGVKFYSSAEAKEFVQILKLKNSKTGKVVKDINTANRELAILGYPYELQGSKEYITNSVGQKKQCRVYTLSRIRQNEQ